MNKIEQHKQMIEQAEKLREEAGELEKLAKDKRHQAREISNDAFALILPFKAGDVIEYSEPRGTFEKKTVSVRILVHTLSEYFGGVSVSGYQVNKRGENTGNSKWFAINQGADLDSIRVIVKGEDR